MKPQILSIGEVADVLEVSTATVRRYCKEGLISSVQSNGRLTVWIDEKIEKFPKWTGYENYVTRTKVQSLEVVNALVKTIHEAKR